jgi:hypothetical protein
MDKPKRFVLSDLPALLGALLGLIVMMNGSWFSHHEPGLDYSERGSWRRAALGERNNLLIFLVFPAMGAAFGSWLGWLFRRSRPDRSQVMTAWIVFALLASGWLGLVMVDAGHNIEYKAFVLALALFLRSITMHGRWKAPVLADNGKTPHSSTAP